MSIVMVEPVQVKHVAADYKSEVKPIWCPGCGDFGVLSAFYKALADLNMDPAKRCSFRASAAPGGSRRSSRRMAFTACMAVRCRWRRASRWRDRN